MVEKFQTRLRAWRGFLALDTKTAGVVMAQAFGVPAFPIDTHIHRLAARWGLSNGTNVVKTGEGLKGYFFQKSHGTKPHLQIIFLGESIALQGTTT